MVLSTTFLNTASLRGTVLLVATLPMAAKAGCTVNGESALTYIDNVSEIEKAYIFFSQGVLICDSDPTEYGIAPCSGQVIEGCDEVRCIGPHSCEDATFTECNPVGCFAEYSCYGANMNRCTTIECYETGSCEYSEIQGCRTLNCDGLYSCWHVSADECDVVECTGDWSCGSSKMAADSVDCMARGSCWNSEISGADRISCGPVDGDSSCGKTKMKDLPPGARVLCRGSKNRSSPAISCAEIQISSDYPIKAVCSGEHACELVAVEPVEVEEVG